MASASLAYPRVASCSLSLALESKDLSPVILLPSTKTTLAGLTSSSSASASYNFSVDESLLSRVQSTLSSIIAASEMRNTRVESRQVELDRLLQEKLLEEAREAEEKEHQRREAAAREAEAKAKIAAESAKLREMKEAYDKQAAALAAMQSAGQITLPIARPVNAASQPPPLSAMSSSSSSSSPRTTEIRQFKELTGVEDDTKSGELLRLLGYDVNHAVALYFSDDPNIDGAIEKAKLLKGGSVRSPSPTAVANNSAATPVRITFILPNSGHLAEDFKSTDTFWTLLSFLCTQYPDLGQKPFKFHHIASGTFYSESQYDSTLAEAKLGSAAMLKVAQT